MKPRQGARVLLVYSSKWIPLSVLIPRQCCHLQGANNNIISFCLLHFVNNFSHCLDNTMMTLALQLKPMGLCLNVKVSLQRLLQYLQLLSVSVVVKFVCLFMALMNEIDLVKCEVQSLADGVAVACVQSESKSPLPQSSRLSADSGNITMLSAKGAASDSCDSDVVMTTRPSSFKPQGTSRDFPKAWLTLEEQQ